MKKYLIKITVSFIVLILILFYIDYIEEKKVKDISESNVVLDFERNNISRLEFQYEDDNVFLFEKREDDWMMLRPYNFWCERGRIVSIISSLENFKYTNKLKNVENKDFGTKKPYFRVILAEEENSYKLYFGDKTFDKKDYYLKYSGSENIYTVSKQLLSNFIPDPFYYKQRKVFDIEKKFVKKVKIVGEDKTLTAISEVESDEFEFFIKANDKESSLNNKKAVELIDSFIYLRAREWMDFENSKYSDISFMNTDYTVEIITVEENIKILIKEKDGHYFAKLADSVEVFTVHEYIFEEFHSLDL
ncbi:MAG: DUF4340 domain-containing protein [Candidatus Muiribacteriota bacterium]